MNFTQQPMPTSIDAIIVGGGLAGLAAAVRLAQNNRTVVLLEKSKHLGGRAQTQQIQQYKLNLGAHALYRKGPAFQMLRELDLSWQGKTPSTRHAFLYKNGELGPFLSPLRMLSHPWFRGSDRVALWRTFFRLLFAKPPNDLSLSWNMWLEHQLPQSHVCRQVAQMLSRLTSYANAPSQQSANATLRQLQTALKHNVLYLDGGWQTLVHNLTTAAQTAGAFLHCNAAVVDCHKDASGYVVQLRDGTSLRAPNLLLALPPKTLRPWVPAKIQKQIDALQPVYAACLDVALSRLPFPKRSLVLGLDAPLYASIHSHTAKLAPGDGAVCHLLKYLPANEPHDAHQTRKELSDLFDQFQPGWQQEVIHQRYLPKITVTHGLASIISPQTPAPPAIHNPETPGLFLLGDWVETPWQLADASVASARIATDAILTQTHLQKKHP